MILIAAATLVLPSMVASADDFFGTQAANGSSDGNLELWELFGPPTARDYIVVDRDTIRFDFETMLRGRHQGCR